VDPVVIQGTQVVGEARWSPTVAVVAARSHPLDVTRPGRRTFPPVENAGVAGSPLRLPSDVAAPSGPPPVRV